MFSSRRRHTRSSEWNFKTILNSIYSYRCTNNYLCLCTDERYLWDKTITSFKSGRHAVIVMKLGREGRWEGRRPRKRRAICRIPDPLFPCCALLLECLPSKGSLIGVFRNFEPVRTERCLVPHPSRHEVAKRWRLTYFCKEFILIM